MANSSPRDANRVPGLGGASSIDGTFITPYVDPTTKRLYTTATVSSSVLPGFNIPAYDYISASSTATTDTYVYKNGGAAGSTVNTITVTYTDSTKATLQSVAKT